jgi:hypothetical protein
MSTTDDLRVLIQRLHTDDTLQDDYRVDPEAAVQGFHLTAHERDAVLTRDADDFVALGLVSSVDELPSVLRPPPATPADPVRPPWWDLRRLVDRVRRGPRLGEPHPPRPRWPRRRRRDR